MTRAILLALAVAGLCAACGGSTTAPSTTTATATRSTETFAGNLGAGDTQFYSFTVTQTGTTDVTLLSVRPSGAVVPALAMPLALSIGTPAGLGCRASTSITVQPGLATQLTTSTTPTIYCVSVADVGNITSAVNFTIRIVHP